MRGRDFIGTLAGFAATALVMAAGSAGYTATRDPDDTVTIGRVTPARNRPDSACSKSARSVRSTACRRRSSRTAVRSTRACATTRRDRNTRSTSRLSAPSCRS